MSKKFVKSIIAMILILVLVLPSMTFANGQENYLSAENVFTQKEVEALEIQGQNKELELDKSDGLTISPQGFGSYPTRKGVILVTSDKYKGIIPTGHAAIIYGPTKVIESLSSGVQSGKNNWDRTRKTCYGVTVKGTTASQDASAANWCDSQRGKPYNYNYLNPWTRSKFYCSQLVYAAFLDKYRINLDTSSFGAAVHPMELVNSKNTTKIYQK